MFAFSIEADTLDSSAIIDYETNIPTIEKMKESYEVLKTLRAKRHKLKHGISTNAEGVVDRIAVVMDAKEYEGATRFCKGQALYPVSNFEELLRNIEDVMKRREVVEMMKDNICNEALMAETPEEPKVEVQAEEEAPEVPEVEALTEPVAQQESEDDVAESGVKDDEAKAEQVKTAMPITNGAESENHTRLKGRLAELSQNPLYQSKKEKDGHHVIAESANSDLKIKVYGESGRSDLTRGAYVYAKTHTQTGKARKISLADISKGGTGLMNFMLEFGNAFTMADISVANNRLWLLNELGKLNILDLEPKLDMKGIHSFFMKKIAQGFEGLDTMTIYAEEVGDRIDIGIWQDTFDGYWEEIAEDTDIDKRAWCKQAKALGWLLPDKGRGGGQHTPSEKRCYAYGKKETERIQRFSVPKAQAKQWMTQRNLQHMMKVGGE